MNKEQILGLARAVGSLVLGYLAGKGWITTEQASTLMNLASQAAPILGAIGLIIYGVYKKRDAAVVQQAGRVTGAVVVVNPDTASTSVVEAANAAPNNEVQLGKL